MADNRSDIHMPSESAPSTSDEEQPGGIAAPRPGGAAGETRVSIVLWFNIIANLLSCANLAKATST